MTCKKMNLNLTSRKYTSEYREFGIWFDQHSVPCHVSCTPFYPWPIFYHLTILCLIWYMEAKLNVIPGTLPPHSSKMITQIIGQGKMMELLKNSKFHRNICNSNVITAIRHPLIPEVSYSYRVYASIYSEKFSFFNSH